MPYQKYCFFKFQLLYKYIYSTCYFTRHCALLLYTFMYTLLHFTKTSLPYKVKKPGKKAVYASVKHNKYFH